MSSIDTLKGLGEAMSNLEHVLNYIFKEDVFLLRALIRGDDYTSLELNDLKIPESLAFIGDTALDVVAFEHFYDKGDGITQKGELDSKR